MDFNKTSYDEADPIYVAQVKDHYRANANMPINLWAKKTRGNS